MEERLLIELIRLLFLLVVGIFKLLFRIVWFLLRTLFRPFGAIARGFRLEGPGGPAPAPMQRTGAPAPVKIAPPPAATTVGAVAAAGRLTTALQALATRARALDARCSSERLCEPLRPTLRDFVLPELARAQGDLRNQRLTSDVPTLSRLASAGVQLDQLMQLLTVMVDQRCDPSSDELIDDADALAEACYRPVVEYCRTNDVWLASNRAAALFGGGCSPALARIDDPTGMAVLHLPWEWLSELHRWPAIGHEVGHDFYDSVAGLDQELLRRRGLQALVGRAGVIEGDIVTDHDVRRIVTHWRQELVADAFGAMMLGPAYAVATAAIFARPDDPVQALAVNTDGDGYEEHPPGHVRVAVVCRLLVRMGYGALAEDMERRWRRQHRDPEVIVLPTTTGYLAIDDEPFIESALDLVTALHREGFEALNGVPLYSMPGFDFGPREHVDSLRMRDTFLAGGPVRPGDARLLIAGAVLAWAERPGDGVRLLRAARLAVGKLDLPVARPAPARTARAESREDLVRDAILLDVLLTPPRASLLRR